MVFIHPSDNKRGLFGLLLSNSTRTVCSGRRPAWTSVQTNCPCISHLSFSTLSWLPTVLCLAAWGSSKCLNDFKFYFIIGRFISQKANSLASVGDHGNTFQISFCWWDPSEAFYNFELCGLCVPFPLLFVCIKLKLFSRKVAHYHNQ